MYFISICSDTKGIICVRDAIAAAQPQLSQLSWATAKSQLSHSAAATKLSHTSY
jgi:hypothetical protein